jgi:hypothetical protein
VKNSCRFDALNQAAVVVIRTVAPAGVTVEERLRALLAWVMEVTNYGIHQGAVGALTATQLQRGGLRGLEPGFPSWSSFHDQEDLVVYFQPTATAISVVMDVSDIILNAPRE